LPKRLIDGERLWTSEKLGKVNPESFRSEYANLLPLALANGVFECSTKRVWRDVYSFNRPSIKAKRVEAILNEYERVRLLFRWLDDANKVWGFWVGIKKEGFLPSKSQLDRKDYKIGPEPPQDILNDFLTYQIDSGLSPKQAPCDHKDCIAVAFAPAIAIAEEFVSLKQNITDKAREILHVRIFPGDQGWSEISSIARIYGQDAVLEKFTEWAETTDSGSYPLTSFLRVADGMLQGEIVRKVDESAQTLINDLVFITNGEVTFDKKQVLAIAKMLSSWNETDIKAAFREFYAQVEGDEFLIKHAARQFVEKADQLLTLQKRRQGEVRKMDDLKERVMSAERMKAEAERAEAQRLQEEEASLIEDTLGS
jgi:hypothetical protein